jgi:hypothetical protein
VAEIHTLRNVSWFKMLNLLIKIRIKIFLTYSLPHLLMQRTDATGTSTSVQLWTVLNHLENVLSFVHIRYHIPL